MLWKIPEVTKLILVDPMLLENFTAVADDGRTVQSLDLQRGLTQADLDGFYENTIRDMPTHVEYHRMRSLEAAKLVEDHSVDFVFLDAMHFYADVVEDIRTWMPKLKPGGTFSGDDMTARFPGVRKAVEQELPNFENTGRLWWAKV